MHKLTIKLKQHTPLIHFQHNQQGATLRATEVKPKLDQFIFEQLTGRTGFAARTAFYEQLLVANEANQNKKLWVVGKGRNIDVGISESKRAMVVRHLALDYQMDFRVSMACEMMPIPYIQTNDKFRPAFPCIFGNVAAEDKKVAVYHDAITMTLSAVNIGLLTYIKEIIAHFFLLTNFGYRQSKGFGAFGISSDDSENNKCRELIQSHRYKFNVRINNNGNLLNVSKVVFGAIELFYKSVRSGINQKDQNGDLYYFKSLLFQYAKLSGKQWEKRSIREHYLLYPRSKYHQIKVDRKNSDTVVYSSENQFLYRDLLGLSSDQEWKFYGDTITKEHLLEDIKRFKSPFTFKPLRISNDEYQVLILVNQVPEGYLNQPFNIRSSSHGGGAILQLNTPPVFYTKLFLEWVINFFQFDGAFDEADFNTYVDIANPAGNLTEIANLKRIYTDLIQYFHAN